MRRYILLFLISSICAFSAIPVFAEEEALKLNYGENKWIAVHCLLQAQIYTQNNYISAKGEGENDAVWAKGFQIRRSRFILNGEVYKDIEFFIQTDDILIGNQGRGTGYATATDYDTETGDTVKNVKDSKGVFTHEAFINYKLRNEFEVTVGLMPVPFMHHGIESAASLLGVDYNATVITPGQVSNEWRDTGIQIRGLWQKNIFDYRFGIFRGQPREYDETTKKTTNPGDAPRFSGRLQLNFMEPETGFFYSGNYLGRKSVISVGGGADFQMNAARIKDKLEDYFAWTGDVTVDYKIDEDMVVTFQGAYLSISNKPGASEEKQWGYFTQAGILLGNIQPVVRYQFWEGDAFNANDIQSSYLSGGLNYFMRGHNANIKFEYQHPIGKDNKSFSGEKKATIQCQVFI